LPECKKPFGISRLVGIKKTGKTMKILILRFSSIGDIVLTSPVMRCIKKQFPEYSLHFATKKQNASLLQFNPYIDKVHLLGDDFKLFCKTLKAEKFDLILDLHHNLRTLRIWSSLMIKRHTVDKLNWEKWLMVRFKVNILPYVHVVDRYLETASHLGVRNDGKGLDFFIDPNESISAFNLPHGYVTYAIGGQHNTKKLPFNKQLELLRSTHQNMVLIGGPEDFEQGEKLANTSANVINLCGKINIHQSALVMQGSEKVFTHDTGMMHIAAALCKPIVSIWGNTIPEFGMTPYLPVGFDERLLSMKEVKGLDCRPCSKIGYEKCPLGHFKCMELHQF
jgi:ADP-heptose:LPS heptosyltransferase